MAVGVRANTFYTEGITATVHHIGESIKPADISNAIRTACDAAYSLHENKRAV